MKNLSDRVAIIGMGCTKVGERWEKSSEDLIVEAAYEAFKEAGIEARQVEAAWAGTLTSGISGQALSRPLKLNRAGHAHRDLFATGQNAFRIAALPVASEADDIVLVAGFKAERHGLFGSARRGLPVIGAGNTAPGAFALAANRYFIATDR